MSTPEKNPGASRDSGGAASATPPASGWGLGSWPQVWTPPGTLTAPPGAHRPETAEVIWYTPDQVEETSIRRAAGLQPFLDRGGVVWVNLNGQGNTDLLADIGGFLDLHPLALEDALTPEQRPKVDFFPGHVFLSVRIMHAGDDSSLEVKREQIGVFLRPPCVVTVQERPGDCLEPLRERIRRGLGRIRKSGADYLFFSILDGVVDHYYPLLERIDEFIEDLEEEALEHPSRHTVERINAAKRALLEIRRAVWPLRESLTTLIHDESELLGDEVRLFLRDTYDHTVQVLDINETCRELAGSIMDILLSSLSNRLNEIMKVLTIIATIFIPLSFLAGVYGMNFKYMPELHWRYGYPAAWAVMITLGLTMLWLFRRAGWIGSPSAEQEGGRRGRDDEHDGD